MSQRSEGCSGGGCAILQHSTSPHEHRHDDTGTGCTLQRRDTQMVEKLSPRSNNKWQGMSLLAKKSLPLCSDRVSLRPSGSGQPLSGITTTQSIPIRDSINRVNFCQGLHPLTLNRIQEYTAFVRI